MKKSDIAERLAGTTALRRSHAIAAVDGVFEAIATALCNGESVYIRGFATFKARTTKEKKARDIGKGTIVTIPAQRTAKLVLSKQLKSRMNDGGETSDL